MFHCTICLSWIGKENAYKKLLYCNNLTVCSGMEISITVWIIVIWYTLYRLSMSTWGNPSSPPVLWMPFYHGSPCKLDYLASKCPNTTFCIPRGSTSCTNHVAVSLWVLNLLVSNCLLRTFVPGLNSALKSGEMSIHHHFIKGLYVDTKIPLLLYPTFSSPEKSAARKGKACRRYKDLGQIFCAWWERKLYTGVKVSHRFVREFSTQIFFGQASCFPLCWCCCRVVWMVLPYFMSVLQWEVIRRPKLLAHADKNYEKKLDRRQVQSNHMDEQNLGMGPIEGGPAPPLQPGKCSYK